MNGPAGLSPSGASGPRGLSDIAYVRIRDLIIAGRLSPGARLIETDLAAKLGVSRGAVRPALSRLRHEGYAEAPDPSQGSGRQLRLVVTPLTKTDAVDLYSLVGELEAMAAAEAATCDPSRHEILMTSLSRIHQSLKRLGDDGQGDSSAFLTVDREFHHAIVRAGAESRPRLLALHGSLMPQVERYALLYAGHVSGHLLPIILEHSAVVEALGRGDAAASRKAVSANWQNGIDRLVALIDRLGQRGDWHGGVRLED